MDFTTIYYENIIDKTDIIKESDFKNIYPNVEIRGKKCGNTIMTQDNKQYIKKPDYPLYYLFYIIAENKVKNNETENTKTKNKKSENKKIRLLTDLGFTQIQNYKKSNGPRMYKDIDSIPLYDERYADDKYFIYQPFGSQNYPDIVIIYYGWVIIVEDKTGKAKIMLNSHNPRPFANCFYIFNINNISTLLLGSEIISENEYKKNQEHEEQIKQKIKELNSLRKDDNFTTFFYPRIMYDITIQKLQEIIKIKTKAFDYLQEIELKCQTKMN